MEIWTVRVNIYEIFVEQQTESVYLSTERGGSTSCHTCWKRVDDQHLSTEMIPYIGEEDEVENSVLIPAISTFLEKNNYVEVGSFYLEGDYMSFTVFDTKSARPLLRLEPG